MFFDTYNYHTPGKIHDLHMFTHVLSEFTITIHRYHEVGPIVYLFIFFLWLLTNPFTSPSMLDLSLPLCPLSHVKATLCTKDIIWGKKIVTSFQRLTTKKKQKQKHAYPEAVFLYSLSVGCLNTFCIAKDARRWLSFHHPTPLCYFRLCSPVDDFVCEKVLFCAWHMWKLILGSWASVISLLDYYTLTI